jgi:uncharacterized membrane protein
MESTYRSVIEKRFISSGLLDGPFIPLYGFGAISLVIYDKFFDYNVYIGALILILIELFASYLIESLFKVKYWDYSKHIFNYKGRICLYYCIIWLIMSNLFYYVIHPLISKYIELNIYNYFISLLIIIYLLFKTKKRISKNLS